jgi:hypothetical protein
MIVSFGRNRPSVRSVPEDGTEAVPPNLIIQSTSEKRTMVL